MKASSHGLKGFVMNTTRQCVENFKEGQFMAATREIAQREMLKGHPDYKAGYEAALRGEPMGIVSAAFDAGWQAATDAKRILGNAGFEETAPGQFNKTITRNLR
jgi:hypothetical protein